MNHEKYIVETTDIFDAWFAKLKDVRAKAKIVTRLERVTAGNFGDHKSVGGGIGELRINEGKGYRLYYTLRGEILVLMLAGGDKSTQQADIAKAQAIREELDHD